MRRGGEGRQSAEVRGEHLLMASEVMRLVKAYLIGSLGHRAAPATRYTRFSPSPRLEFESVPESGQITIYRLVLSGLTSIHRRFRMYPTSGLSLLLQENLRLRNFSQASSFLPHFGLAIGVSN